MSACPSMVVTGTDADVGLYPVSAHYFAARWHWTWYLRDSWGSCHIKGALRVNWINIQEEFGGISLTHTQHTGHTHLHSQQLLLLTNAFSPPTAATCHCWCQMLLNFDSLQDRPLEGSTPGGPWLSSTLTLHTASVQNHLLSRSHWVESPWPEIMSITKMRS